MFSEISCTSIPTVLNGWWVVPVGQNSFADNAILTLSCCEGFQDSILIDQNRRRKRNTHPLEGHVAAEREFDGRETQNRLRRQVPLQSEAQCQSGDWVLLPGPIEGRVTGKCV